MVSNKKSKKIVVLATGGTIAGKANPPGSATAYTAAQFGVEALVAVIPNLAQALDGDELLSEQVAQLDSKNMNHAVWQRLAQRCLYWLAQDEVRGLVVTHGTDTLEETAWFLQQVLGAQKPVVMTCAMRPADAPEPDGPSNLRDALTVVREAQVSGVCVVCAGSVHGARTVQKVHPTRLSAFGSGEIGPCATVNWPSVAWLHKPEAMPRHEHAELALRTDVAHWPWVAVLHNHAQVDPRQVRALVSAGVQGVSVRSTSRCTEGPIVGQPNALTLAPAGLNVYKARISLMLDLMR